MSEHVNQFMDTTVEKIKKMVDSSTVVGQPIHCGENITILPVSKITYGFASGGSDFASKNTAKDLFGGGSGAGVTVSPVTFLVIQNGEVKMMPIAPPAGNTGDRAIDALPALVDKVSALFQKNKSEAKPEENASAE